MPVVPRYNVNMYAIAKNIKHDDDVFDYAVIRRVK